MLAKSAYIKQNLKDRKMTQEQYKKYIMQNKLTKTFQIETKLFCIDCSKSHELSNTENLDDRVTDAWVKNC